MVKRNVTLKLEQDMKKDKEKFRTMSSTDIKRYVWQTWQVTLSTECICRIKKRLDIITPKELIVNKAKEKRDKLDNYYLKKLPQKKDKYYYEV